MKRLNVYSFYNYCSAAGVTFEGQSESGRMQVIMELRSHEGFFHLNTTITFR